MLIKPADDTLLDWYYCQTAFERSSFGGLLVAQIYYEAAALHVEERNRYLRQLRREQVGNRAGMPWDPAPVTAFPRRETRAAGGIMPTLYDHERKAMVERRLLAMEREGRKRECAILGVLYSPDGGGYYHDRKLPRAYALYLYTEPGLKLLARAHRHLKPTAVGQRLEREGKKVPPEELGERALAHHEQMALHCQRRKAKCYDTLSEMWAAADLIIFKMESSAYEAWNAARVVVDRARTAVDQRVIEPDS